MKIAQAAIRACNKSDPRTRTNRADNSVIFASAQLGFRPLDGLSIDGSVIFVSAQLGFARNESSTAYRSMLGGLMCAGKNLFLNPKP